MYWDLKLFNCACSTQNQPLTNPEIKEQFCDPKKKKKKKGGSKATKHDKTIKAEKSPDLLHLHEA